MERKILHIDVNNAFLSWLAVYKLQSGETLDIRTIPAIIGGDEETRKGIVLAKSMKAKEIGIVTGEPIYQARIKCPQVKVFKGNFEIYRKYSNKLYTLLLNYTDKIERYSIDECFLDMTEYLMKDTLENKAKEISKRVKQELGFTVNIGVSNNKLLAKMASDFEKPDKIHTLYQNEIQTKMWGLPVSELFMLGKKSVPKLQRMGIKTIGDLAKKERQTLIKNFGKHGNIMWEYANGIDNAEVNYKYEKPKSISNATTLPMDLCNIEKIERILFTLTEQVAYRLRQYNLVANTVNIQLRTKAFIDFSHQGRLDIATSNTKHIFTKARALLKEMYKEGTFIRLVGIKVDNLEDREQRQISMFEDKNKEKLDKIDSVLDNLKKKYGYDAITYASTKIK
jgi:DNA polymerase-4